MNKDHNFDKISFIKGLLGFSPRQGKNEVKAAKFIISFLDKSGVDYLIQKFDTKVPLIKEAKLMADGKKIECKGCSFVSGKIENKDYLISNLTPSSCFLEYPNINFNPKCKVISLDNFYFAPSVTIKTNDLSKVAKAKKVKGEVKVEEFVYESANILVGNVKNPKNILFAHYDSVEKGATDNGSGVAVLMDLILSYPGTMEDNLYIFSGNEELSYDKPTYWGHGFRVFEKEYDFAMAGAVNIMAVDCVGNGKTNVSHDKHLIKLAFPINNLDKWSDKISVVFGDFDRLMSVYHSNNDDISELKGVYLDEAVKLLNLKFKG
jgi:Iap family predicted aminopeptidase